MPHIFASEVGRVAKVEGTSFVPITITLQGWENGYETMKGILTGIGVSGTGGQQFMHTLRDYIYVYVFGERIGEMIIHGIAFADTCNPVDNVTGMEKAILFYENRRLSTTGIPLLVTIGNTITLQGFLVAFQSKLEDASLMIADFTLQFRYPPRRQYEFARI